MDRPAIESEMHIEIPEHAALLSFNGDADCVLFHEWWDEKGWGAFEKWAEKRRKRNQQEQ